MNDDKLSREQLLAELTALRRTSAAVTMKALFENEKRYRELVERMRSGVAIYEARDNGADFVIRDITGATKRLGQARRKEMIGKSVREVFPGLVEFGLFAVLQRVWQTGNPEHHPVAEYRDDKLMGWYENFVYKLPSGEVVAIYDNVTEEKRTEEALRESEERYRALFTGAAEGILVADAQTKQFLFANPAICRMFGYEESEMVRLGVEQIHPAGGYPRILAEFAAQARGEKILAPDLPCRRKDGSLFYADISTSAMILGGRECVAGLFTDITARKQAEQKLLFISKAIETVSVAIGISDAQGRHVYQNKALSDLFEYPTAEELEAAGGGAVVVKDPLVAKEMFDNIMSGKPWSGELEMVTKSGRVFTAYEYADSIIDTEGNIQGLIGIINDITDRKMAEETLRESELLFRESQRVAEIGSYRVDFVANRWQSSEFLDYIFGIDEKYNRSVPGWLELVHPDDREMMGRYLQDEVIARRKPFAKEYRIIRRNDGETRWVHGLGKVDFDPAGNVVSMVGTIQDISERRKIEDELARSRALLQGVVDDSSALIYATDLDGKFILFNRALERMFGVGREAVIGRTRFDALAGIMTPQVAEEHWRNDQSVAASGRVVEHEERNSEIDGMHIYRSVKYPLRDAAGRIIGVAGISTDITAGKLLEARLRESQRLLSEAQGLAGVGSWEWHVASDQVTWSEQLYRIAGRDPQLPPPAFAEHSSLYSREGRAMFERAVARALQEGESFELELDLLRPDGEVRHTTMRGQAERDVSGRVVRLHGAVQDITDRKRAETELDRIFELSPDLLCIAGPDGKFIRVNPAWETVLGFTTDEIMELGYAGLIHPDDIAPTMAEVKKQLRGESTVNFVNRYRCKDGSYLTLEWKSLSAEDGCSYAVARDITARRREEDRIRQQIDELQRWHTVTLNREERVMELKREVNELRARLNEPPRYPDDGPLCAGSGSDNDD